MTGKTRKILIIITAFLLMLIPAVFIIRNRGILWSILKPFVIGIIIAYIFNPLVEALIKRGLERMAAVLIVYSAILSAAAGLLSFLLPSVYREAMKMMDILPSYALRAKEYLDGVYLRFSRSLTPELREAIRNNIDYIQEIVIIQVNRIADKLVGIFKGLVNWIIALVVSFYLLKDKDYFLDLIGYIIPVRLRQDTARVGREIDSVLMGFIRGELLVALVVGVLASIGFLLIDLNFAILMGIITGL
ncbi:MAG TPA: AI-2E family transporter, partial [Bacillota bacterium]|nr:AI-2E family transporter [Bacillota bacterium]